MSLVQTIVKSFTSPTITSQQVLNLVVSAGSSRRFRRSLQSSSIYASYQIATSSKYPASAYSTELTNSVNSGAFDTNLHTTAAAYGATYFVTATSGPVSVGEYWIVAATIDYLTFYFCYRLHSPVPYCLPGLESDQQQRSVWWGNRRNSCRVCCLRGPIGRRRVVLPVPQRGRR